MSEATKQFYSHLFQRYGTDCRALSFNSAQTQRARFAALTAVLPADREARLSVLDVGCGFADLYGYLREAGYRHIDYTGVDLMPEFIAQAAARWPEARFAAEDFLADGAPAARYDYVLSSGALNVVTGTHPDHYDFVFGMVSRMYDLAGQGVAFNLLSTRGQRDFAHDPRFFFCDPARIHGHCQTLAADTELDHGYLSYDFAIRSRKAIGAAP